MIKPINTYTRTLNKTGKSNHKGNQVYLKGENAVKSQLQEIVYSDSKTLILSSITGLCLEMLHLSIGLIFELTAYKSF